MGNAVKTGADQEGTIGLLYPTPSGGGETGPTEEDAKVAKWVWANYTAAKRWKEQGEYQDAKENWGYWNEKQWKYQRAPHLTMAVVNQVYPTVETFIGHFADNLPESIARSRNPAQKRVGEMATKLFNWSNDINGVRSLNELNLRSACITGFSVRAVDWDWSADGKRGAPRFRFINEEGFFLAPWTRNPDLSDCRYTIEAGNIPRDEAKRLFPKRADDIKPGAWDGSLTPQFMGGSGSQGFAEYLTFPSGKTVESKGGSGSEPGTGDLVTYIRQCYRQDDGSIRDTVVINSIVCTDDQLPYEDEEYPYTIFNVLRNKDSAYGHSLVRFMKNLQDSLNQLVSLMIDYQRYQSNTPLVAKLPNLDNGPITNAPDSVLVDRTPDGQGFYTLSQGGANSQFLNIAGFVIESLNQKTGNVDILRGEQPASVTTLGAMEILRDEANVLVKKMGLQILEAVRRADKLCLNRLKQFMKDERTIRISGKGGQEHVTVNQRVGLGMDGSWIVANTIPDDFEADIDMSPMPPGGMQAKFERAMALYAASDPVTGETLVDDQYVLESIEEDPEMVAQLMERKAANAEAQAKAEQQAAAAEAGGVPPEEEEMSDDEARIRAMRFIGGGV